MMSRAEIRDVLIAAGNHGDAVERHAFAALVAAALFDRETPFLDWLGLSPVAARALFAAYFPAFPVDLPERSKGRDIASEEGALRTLLLQHRADDGIEAEWAAAIVARRAQAPNHLWEDMGFADRGELNGMMSRFFPTLKALNRDDMRWKKFLYRLLCEQTGTLRCKSPSCSLCSDVAVCFEPGSRLLMRAAG